MKMPDFEDYLTHCLDSVPASRVRDAMQYSLMAGGKRVRPKLLLAVLNAYAQEEAIGYPLAAAIEMIPVVSPGQCKIEHTLPSHFHTGED